MDRLDELIKNIKDEAFWRYGSEVKKQCNDTVNLLIELKQLRRSQMQPAVKYLTNGFVSQFEHMKTEIDEIDNEIENYFITAPQEETEEILKNMAMEIIDLQFSCQTMLEGPLKLTKEQIADYVQMVVKKNADRNYDKAE